MIKTRAVEYPTWVGMMNRCYRESAINYKYYGGRGITVCERWRNSFEDFLADMGPRPDGMTLDRKDSDGNYEPGNCRWADRLTQSHNSSQPTKITVNGVEYPSISAACRAYSTNLKTLHGRRKRGLSLEEAISLPKQPTRKKSS